MTSFLQVASFLGLNVCSRRAQRALDMNTGDARERGVVEAPEVMGGGGGASPGGL